LHGRYPWGQKQPEGAGGGAPSNHAQIYMMQEQLVQQGAADRIALWRSRLPAHFLSHWTKVQYRSSVSLSKFLFVGTLLKEQVTHEAEITKENRPQ
jgi:hypothetical protein